MLPHWHLWPAIAGAAFGLALIVWASLWYVRAWRTLAPRTRWLAFAAIALFETLYWLNVHAWLIEPKLLVVRRIEIESPGWRGDPIVIAAIGDTHAGSAHVDAARVGRIVDRVNALRPDLVLLLGDYAGGHEPEVERSAPAQSQVLGGVAALAGLKAPLGAVAVLGNHDSWYGRQSIAQALEAAGVAVLWNRSVIVSREGAPFAVAGLADFDTGEPDFARALDGAEGRDAIVISHSPDPFADMPAGPALMLAAHSHCGQVTIPLVGRPILPIRNRAYACGLVEEAGRTMFVTGGVGTSIVPVRFLNPPEIVLITLRSSPRA